MQTVEKKSFPEDIKNRIEKALYWMAKGTLEGEHHLSVVYYVAALENLLFRERKDRWADKSSLVPARIMILNTTLGQGFQDPGLMRGIVHLRNYLLHEGSGPIFAQEGHSKRAYSLAKQTLVNILKLYQQQRFSHFDSMIDYLNSQNQVKTDIVNWLTRVRTTQNQETVDKILKAIKKILLNNGKHHQHFHLLVPHALDERRRGSEICGVRRSFRKQQK